MDRKIEILILTNSIFPLSGEDRERILRIAPEAALTVVKKEEVTPEQLGKAEIIFGWPEQEHLRTATNLRWLQLPSAGADSYMDREVYHHQDILLTNSSGVFGLPIAEHVFAMILAYNRNLTEYAWQQKESKWKGIRRTKDFYGSTIGIIGMGDIGTEVAKRAKALGAKVLGVKRTLSAAPEYVDRIYTTEALDEVLEQSDYVVLAVPGTKKTTGLITEERLRKMKPDAFLVNIGRGTLVDQEALIRALREGWIGGAGLDVTTPEPLPQDSPLWELSNVIITPHASGSSPSNDIRRMGIFLRNLERYLSGQTLENLVNFEEGY
jgi:phosphoglycerate dehydrogenase-like enzyme